MLSVIVRHVSVSEGCVTVQVTQKLCIVANIKCWARYFKKVISYSYFSQKVTELVTELLHYKSFGQC